MDDSQGALVGGLIGLGAVAVVLVVLGAAPLTLLPLAVVGVWLAILLVQHSRR